MTPDERKRLLIAEGAMYRAEAVRATVELRAGLRTGLNPVELAGGALRGLAGAASGATAVGGLAAGLPVWLPLALRGAAYLKRHPALRKLAVGAGVAATIVAGLAGVRGWYRSRADHGSGGPAAD